MSYDYGHKLTNDHMNEPASLPEYGERARKLIEQTLGYFPHKHLDLAGNELVVRIMLDAMDKSGGKLSQQEIEDGIKAMFRPIHKSEHDESVRKIH